jgi:hypothetical protein
VVDRSTGADVAAQPVPIAEANAQAQQVRPVLQYVRLQCSIQTMLRMLRYTRAGAAAPGHGQASAAWQGVHCVRQDAGFVDVWRQMNTGLSMTSCAGAVGKGVQPDGVDAAVAPASRLGRWLLCSVLMSSWAAAVAMTRAVCGISIYIVPTTTSRRAERGGATARHHHGRGEAAPQQRRCLARRQRQGRCISAVSLMRSCRYCIDAVLL